MTANYCHTNMLLLTRSRCPAVAPSKLLLLLPVLRRLLVETQVLPTAFTMNHLSCERGVWCDSSVPNACVTASRDR